MNQGDGVSSSFLKIKAPDRSKNKTIDKMIDKLYGAARKRKDSGKSYKLIYKLNKFIAVTLYPLLARNKKSRGIDENSIFIISLTSFPSRINTVWITISTLFDQKIKAKRVLLYLAKDQFPNGEKELPGNLLKLKKRGLEIIFCNNLMPHKKYYYAIKDNPESIVITVDDDMLYPENLTEELLEKHKEYPDSVVCEYAHIINFNREKKEFEPYQSWKSCYEGNTKPDIRILPVGCGGVLYPPHCLDERIFDEEKINKLCPMTDDLWLKAMEILKGTKAIVCKKGSQIYFDMVGTRKYSLQHENCGKNKNDESLKNIVNEYPELLDILSDYIDESNSNNTLL